MNATFIYERIRKEFFSAPDFFDKSHGIETRRSVWRKRLGFGTGYQAVSPEIFAQAVAFVPRWPFIDVGCGKGRALILAAEHGFTDLTGIEFSAPLAASAKRNLVHLKISAHIEQGDARTYDFPKEPCIVFLYNPFGPDILRTVLSRLGSHYLIYVTPLHADVIAEFPYQIVYKRPHLAIWKRD